MFGYVWKTEEAREDEPSGTLWNPLDDFSISMHDPREETSGGKKEGSTASKVKFAPVASVGKYS